MVQERDAEQLSSLPESAGEDAILLAGAGIAGGVIVAADPDDGVHQDQRFEDLAWMHDSQSQGADRDDVDPDDGMLRIQPTDQELLAVQSCKKRSEDGRSGDRGIERQRGRYGPVVADERDPVSRHGVFISRLRLPDKIHTAL